MVGRYASAATWLDTVAAPCACKSWRINANATSRPASAAFVEPVLVIERIDSLAVVELLSSTLATIRKDMPDTISTMIKAAPRSQRAPCRLRLKTCGFIGFGSGKARGTE